MTPTPPERLRRPAHGILDMARIEASGGLTPVAPSHRQGLGAPEEEARPAADQARGSVLGLSPGLARRPLGRGVPGRL